MEEGGIDGILSSFVCKQDEDIEQFLRNRAVQFENLSKSRTFLVCDDDQFASGKIVIIGYFTLAMKTLVLPEEMSIRARKEFDGFSGKIHGAPVREIPCYLIGQLARDDRTPKEELPGWVLLEKAISIINGVVKNVGGRWVLVECHNKPGLIKFYENNHFQFIFSDIDNDEPMIQFIRRVE